MRLQVRDLVREQRWWWLVAVVAAPPLVVGGPVFERCALALAMGAALLAVVAPARRAVLSAAVASVLLALAAALIGHLLADDFAYRYVWLYSATSLPWYLKLANLWGGDEGTLLLLSAMTAVAARRLIRYPGWAGPGALLITASFATAALIWNPFAALPPANAERLEGLGMNAHLLRVWMAFHPPLIFTAYVLYLAPVGGALQALATGEGSWPSIARRFDRAAWLTLSIGLVAGMWWAYEDFSFGQIWQWDVVQTSVFAVWALSTASLHCLNRYKANGAFARCQPLLSILTGLFAIVAMIVTRTSNLASSHRYVGESSFPFFVFASLVLGALTVAALVVSRKSSRNQRVPTNESMVLLWVAVGLFVCCAIVAIIHVAEAFVSAYLNVPRPEHLKPFFETLSRWTYPAEQEKLRSAFAQWDVDNFAINRWLAVVGAVVALFGGHNFLPMRRRAWRWAVTLTVAAAACLVALELRPFASLFHGTGMTSRSTVAIFPLLDALVAAIAYFGLAVVLWIADAIRRRRTAGRILGYHLPIGLIHVGAVMALTAGLVATVFDSYAQKMLLVPDDMEKPQAMPDGFEVTVRLGPGEYIADGGHSLNGAPAYRAEANVGWRLDRDGSPIAKAEGQTVFRDDRPPAVESEGPVRLMCEMIDYRYARFVSGSSRMIHPFIHRGLWQDVQVWLPNVDPILDAAAEPKDAGGRREPITIPMVLKVYPLMTWFWFGLGLVVAGMGVVTVSSILRLKGK